MKISKIFSTRNLLLIAFILVVLFLGTMFSVKVSHESFVEAIKAQLAKKIQSDESKRVQAERVKAERAAKR